MKFTAGGITLVAWGGSMFHRQATVVFGVTAFALVTATPVLAQNTCAGAKIKAAAKKASCLLTLAAGQASKGGTIDPVKVTKCQSNVTDNGIPGKPTGFAKIESKATRVPCLTVGDAAPFEAMVDAFVDDVVTDLDVATGTNPNACEGSKIKATAKKVKCLATLQSKQAAKGGTIDPLKVLKCESGVTDNGVPGKPTGFAKIEGKAPCNTIGDGAAIEAKVDAFIADVVDALRGVDLAASQTVSDASPFYYAPVTFTTTVTNTSTTATSDGVTVVVNVPAGLISPAVTTSAGSYDASTGTWAIGSLAPGATATLTITAFAAAVSDGAQTVTATVSAATFDHNSVNDTASASETSRHPPVEAVITPGPGASNPVDICAPDPLTWYGSALNAANPAAPPSSAGNVIFVWSCASIADCPTPVNDITNSTFITYTAADFQLGQSYTLNLLVVPDQQSEDRVAAVTNTTFTTTCLAFSRSTPRHSPIVAPPLTRTSDSRTP